jgi:hypothetical protein
MPGNKLFPPSPCLNWRRRPQAQARSDHCAGLGETAMGVARPGLVAEASRGRVRIGGHDSESTTIWRARGERLRGYDRLGLADPGGGGQPT